MYKVTIRFNGTSYDFEANVNAQSLDSAKSEALVAARANGFTGGYKIMSVEEVKIEDKRQLSVVVDEQLPADFYENSAKYEAILDDYLVIAKGLVHSIDEIGRKQAKSDSYTNAYASAYAQQECISALSQSNRG